jgi:hypothetical protein
MVPLDFASTFVDAVAEDSVLAVPRVSVPAFASTSPFEALDIDAADGFESDGFESADFESADVDLEESD